MQDADSDNYCSLEEAMVSYSDLLEKVRQTDSQLAHFDNVIY